MVIEKIPIINRFVKHDAATEQLTGDLAVFLMDYGMKPEQAFKLSKGFWEKNKNKLKEALRL
jgi:hypothetical protein